MADRTCSIEGCERALQARGLCMRHYGALHRSGAILPRPDPRDAFWAHVIVGVPEACWEWQAFVNDRGYGQGTAAGRRFLAHRRAWELTQGCAIPDGLFVCHRCDNPPCCNPAHLFLGTNSDNVADMDAKGRRGIVGFRFGTEHHSSKLDPDQVRAIRRRNVEGARVTDLAREFGVSRGAIQSVIKM